MKARLQSEEDLGQKGTDSKLITSKDFSEQNLGQNHPFLSYFVITISKNVRDGLVDCIFAHVKEVTFAP